MSAMNPTVTNADSNQSGIHVAHPLDRYRSLHLWMIAPMVLMQLGIGMDYWGKFPGIDWSIHVHYWTATAWYGYLVLQPWLATRGRMAAHRTNGMIGLFIAGGVVFTALSMMARTVGVAELSLNEPERFGPFVPEFFYGVAALEVAMMILFGAAIVMSILRRKQIHEHAWWLISTVFLIMASALGRGIQNVFILFQIDRWPDIDLMPPAYLTQALILMMILAAAWKYRKLRHPATYLAVGMNVAMLFVFQLGSLPWIQAAMRSVFTD